jgi:hypothetical protein
MYLVAFLSMAKGAREESNGTKQATHKLKRALSFKGLF